MPDSAENSERHDGPKVPIESWVPERTPDSSEYLKNMPPLKRWKPSDQVPARGRFKTADESRTGVEITTLGPKAAAAMARRVRRTAPDGKSSG